MRISLHRPGTRVRIVRGSTPLDPDLIGLEGVVLDSGDYRPGHYVVSLRGEEAQRSFAEDELEHTGPHP